MTKLVVLSSVLTIVAAAFILVFHFGAIASSSWHSAFRRIGI